MRGLKKYHSKQAVEEIPEAIWSIPFSYSKFNYIYYHLERRLFNSF